MFKNLLLILFITILQSCSISDKKIEEQGWKLLSDHISSVCPSSFHFATSAILKGDTIYVEDKPCAIIIKRKWGIPTLYSDEIEVVDIETKNRLTYVAY
jgi:hypothetical protein